jgi:hypothetical protein
MMNLGEQLGRREDDDHDDDDNSASNSGSRVSLFGVFRCTMCWE